MRVKLEKLNDMVFMSDVKDDSFVGYTTEKHKDINNNVYETLKSETKYLYLTTMFESKLYVTEEYLLETLLTDYLKPLRDNSIYDHGYPEGRLIPSNFTEDCQNNYRDEVISSITDKISDIISDNF